MGVIKALNAVSGTAFPQFFVLHHSPTENDALVCTAENPRTLEFLQEVLDLLLAAPNHPCKDSRKDRPKDQRKDTLPGSPSSSSSSSSARHKNTASENFNATEIAQILCQRNGWSGQGMIWALQEAIDFKATEMPEATLEQVGEWLVTGGIRCGELWTIGALPGKGKTALGVQVALANGSAGIPTYAFSLEMQDLEIGKRFLAAKSSVAAGQIRNPQTIREDRWSDLRRAAADISECPIYVDVRGSIKIQELLASARLYIRRHGVKLIVVDYLRLVDAPGRATGQD